MTATPERLAVMVFPAFTAAVSFSAHMMGERSAGVLADMIRPRPGRSRIQVNWCGKTPRPNARGHIPNGLGF